MGTFNWPLRVSSMYGQQSRDIEATVDTGATCATLPAGLLRELGVAPMGKRRFLLADGRRKVKARTGSSRGFSPLDGGSIYCPGSRRRCRISGVKECLLEGGEEVTMPARPAEETARLGDEIYERDIRSQVEGTCHGKIVAIDVDTGEYAVADSVIAASERVRAQYPDADVWIVRVGYRALGSFGGQPLRRAE